VIAELRVIAFDVAVVPEAIINFEVVDVEIVGIERDLMG